MIKRLRLSRPVGKILFSLGLSLGLLLSLLPIVTVFGASLRLYDGAQGNFPDEQGFFVFPPFNTVPATQTHTTGGTIFDTTPNESTKIGYFGRNNLIPVLDRTYGYTVTFAVQVITETHAGSDKNSDGIDDRAGFSLIVLSSDLEGIELGFWTNEIWVQEEGTTEPPRFTHAEGVAFDTSSLITYDLAIISNTYTLSAAGITILTGSLRNYSNEGFPYTTSNFLFFGDDTTSAKAKIKLTYVAITANSVPPSSVTLNGPTSGTISTTYTFTAAVTPITTTAPLTYTWQASEQTPVTRSSGLSDTINFIWTTPGPKNITVTVSNGAVQVTRTYTISLATVDKPDETFLPVILKSN